MFRRMMLVGVVALVLVLAGGVVAQAAPLNVIATTTILADVAQNIAGDRFTVTALVPVNADSHAFEPSVDDARRVSEADLVLTIGAGYEQFIEGLLENAGANIPVVTANNGVNIRPLGVGHEPEHEGEAEATEHADHDDHELGGDPHTWMDPQNVMVWVGNIRDAFSLLDHANAAIYEANADAYLDQLAALDAELQAQVDTLPAEARILVTNHEFMGYFADRFGFEMVGTVLPGGTTDAEPDPQGMADLIALIQSEGVPAIFAEVSANPELAEIIASEAGVNVVTALYSESLSDAAGPAPTYLDFMRHNTRTIVDALMG
jgi:ABC-type Zn uptake system ZnuABC Zn-binding protein ZnuA